MGAKVAIITRTKNRPLLLRRAAESVARQSYENYLWIVVNDGGDEQEVRSVLDSSRVRPDRIRLISNPTSVGMEAASNIGVNQSDSDYILIHDDDDTLAPSFLEKTVGFLESEEGARFSGVTTRVEYVSEEIAGGEVIVHDRRPYLEWVDAIEISELLAQNTITTISFVYRRELFEVIGGYREDLPVLGDWYFNLHFALRADIKVLPEVLAYYHHRDRGEGKPNANYANSVIEAHDKHQEFAAICRNMLIREGLEQGGFSAAIAMGYFVREFRHSTQGLVGQKSDTGLNSSDESRQVLELDRLWLLAQILNEKARRASRFRKSIPDIEMHLPSEELMQIAQEFRIPIQPPANFDESGYLEMYPDVARAVSKGLLASGFEHYMLNGSLEGRNRPEKA